VPVIIDSVHRNPRRRYEDYDASYTLAGRLAAAGVQFCISGSDRNETWNARNLPYHAGTAAAYGLSYEDAVRSITIFPAQILGIDDKVGTLEEGKDATIIVTDGDPLETDTQVLHAWVQGRPVQLSSRHTRLNDKYRQKYKQLRGQK
jgi:imidazolonepropionase-like amidohydrolase